MVTTNPQSDVRVLRRAIVEAGFRCIACIPLLARGSVVGVMGLATRRERSLDQRELNLLSSIGALAGVTIEMRGSRRKPISGAGGVADRYGFT
jgi:GAF domain-containing protein